MAFFDDMASVAHELIDEFGGPVVITRETSEVFDPVTGTITTPGTTIEYEGVGAMPVILNNYIDDTQIARGDRVIVIPAKNLDIEPAMNDRITFKGSEYTIYEVGVSGPASTDIAYICKLRK